MHLCTCQVQASNVPGALEGFQVLELVVADVQVGKQGGFR